MITVKTNINQVVQKVTVRVREIGDADKLLRTCATSVLSLMKKRIHRDGIAANGSQIGKYSPSYMLTRVSVFKRTADTKVIASATRQMENDMKVIATSRGYGIGYTNSQNFNKSKWVEGTYKKKIFALADTERQAIKDIVNNAVPR